VLRDIYNQGAARITAERARLVAQNLPEAQIAERLSGMRHELAESVRRTGSSLMRKGAELFDAVRGNVGRPTYESLRAAGRTDARIIERAAETNRFINRLPSGLRWTGRALWVVQVGLSIYIVLQAPPEARGEAARLEVEGLIGGGAGAFIGEGICVVAGIATEGLALILCGLIGGGLGFEGARRGHLLEVLDIAPHQIPALAGTIYRIEGAFEESDFFIFSVVHRTVSASENILVVATGLRSGEQVGGRGHYHSLEVTPSNPPAVQLFGNTQARLVPEYLLRIATPDDLRRSRD
jgi:hypothetical protein